MKCSDSIQTIGIDFITGVLVEKYAKDNNIPLNNIIICDSYDDIKNKLNLINKSYTDNEFGSIAGKTIHNDNGDDIYIVLIEPLMFRYVLMHEMGHVVFGSKYQINRINYSNWRVICEELFADKYSINILPIIENILGFEIELKDNFYLELLKSKEYSINQAYEKIKNKSSDLFNYESYFFPKTLLEYLNIKSLTGVKYELTTIFKYDKNLSENILNLYNQENLDLNIIYKLIAEFMDDLYYSNF